MEYNREKVKRDGDMVSVIRLTEVDWTGKISNPYSIDDEDGSLVAVEEAEHPLVGRSEIKTIGMTSEGEIVIGRVYGGGRPDSYAIDKISEAYVDGGSLQNFSEGDELEKEMEEICTEWEFI